MRLAFSVVVAALFLIGESACTEPECSEADCDDTFANAEATCGTDSSGGGMKCLFEGCKSGFHNLDGDQTNGCEYACTPHETPVCGEDNDCDGQIDQELFDVRTDPRNCGACGHACESEMIGAVTACVGGSCELAFCQAGHFDTDGNPTNGCESTSQ